MAMRHHFFLWAILPAALAMAALGQAAPAASAATGAPVPDFTGIWWHPFLPGMEPLASGPTSIRNLSRRNGISNYDQLVGDYNNPILQPWAAAVVRNFGDLSKAGVMYPSPANQCWPEPLPYSYKNFSLMVLQQPDEITLVTPTRLPQGAHERNASDDGHAVVARRFRRPLRGRHPGDRHGGAEPRAVRHARPLRHAL